MTAADRDAIAEAMALVDDYDGCFERIREWEALPQWERDAYPDERPHMDYEDREFWRRRADAALALVRPAAGIALTPEEAERAAAWYHAAWAYAPTSEVATSDPALVARLEAAS